MDGIDIYGTGTTGTINILIINTEFFCPLHGMFFNDMSLGTQAVSEIIISLFFILKFQYSVFS